ncbi:MAG: PilZ domain-containing protein [Spirochaetaceae bacterium]|jgi:hypothetical protein|nr:PilZ domain-containing protein [Spirochaetaceae bacterium]
MIENFKNRKEPRELCFARILVKGIPGQLRDINNKGLKIALFSNIELIDNQPVKIQIFPDENWKISDLSVDAVLRWKTDDKVGCTLGLSFQGVDIHEKKGALDQLINFYRQ